MKPSLLLRIASVLTIIEAIFHTMGGVFGKQDPGAQQTVATTMKTITFPVFGNTRSFWDFHIGFGLAMTCSMLTEGILFWQLSTLAKTDANKIRPILWTFFIGYLFVAANAYIFFFFAPVVFTLITAACLGGSIWLARAEATSSRKSFVTA